MTDIKPCPFCGSTSIIETQGDTFRWVKMKCSDCGASCGDVRIDLRDPNKSTQLAIDEWNKRND